jgi:hypothetical protein
LDRRNTSLYWHCCIVYISGWWQGNRLSNNANYSTIACWWN